MTKYLSIILLIITLLAPLSGMAQDIGAGQGGWLNTIADKAFYKTNIKAQGFLDTTVGQLIAIFLGFLGILFLAFIIYSGIQWMTGGGNEEKVEKAKTRIKNAVLGLALVFFSWIITNIVFLFLYQQAGR